MIVTVPLEDCASAVSSLADHRIGPFGERCAREYADRLTRAHLLGGELTGGYGFDDVEFNGVHRQVGASHRVAIHGGVVPGRQVDRARDGFGEYGVEGIAQGEPHLRQRLEMADDEPRRFGGRHGARIFARSQARLATVTSHAVSLKRNTGKGAW